MQGRVEWGSHQFPGLAHAGRRLPEREEAVNLHVVVRHVGPPLVDGRVAPAADVGLPARLAHVHGIHGMRAGMLPMCAFHAPRTPRIAAQTHGCAQLKPLAASGGDQRAVAVAAHAGEWWGAWCALSTLLFAAHNVRPFWPLQPTEGPPHECALDAVLFLFLLGNRIPARLEVKHE